MKRKLVAALLSVAMVASITPTTPFTAAATVEAAYSTSVTTAAEFTAAVNNLGKAEYTSEWKAAYDIAAAGYDNLSATDKVSVATAKTKLDNLKAAYDKFDKVIADATAALEKVAQVTADDFETNNGVDGVALAAIKAYEALNVTAGTYNEGYNFQEKVNDTYYVSEDLLAKGELLSSKGAVGSQQDTNQYAVVNAYNYLGGLDLNVTTSNYNLSAITSQITTAKTAVAAYKNILANYSLITAAENKVAKYTDAVAAVVTLADVEDFTATIKDDAALAKVQAAYDTVKEAYDELDTTLQGKATFTSKSKGGFAARTTIKNALTSVETAIKNYDTGKSNASEAETVTKQILALPAKANVALTDEDAIVAASKAYNEYIDKYGEANSKVSDAAETHLNDAKTALEALIKELGDTDATDAQKQQRADRVLKYINQLPSNPNNATLDDLDIIASAVKEYNGKTWDGSDKFTRDGSESAWQKLITDDQYNILIGCSEKVVELKAAQTNALEGLVAKYNALSIGNNETLAGTVAYNTRTTYTNIKGYVEQAEKDVQAAKDAYNNASSDVKALFDATDKTKDNEYTKALSTLETAIAKAKDHDSTKELLSEIKLAFAAVDAVTDENKTEVAQQVAAVDTLLALANNNTYIKDLFKTVNGAAINATYYSVTGIATKNYADAKAAGIKATAQQEAAPVVDLIKAVTVLDGDKVYTDAELNTAYTAIKNARDAYNSLSDEAQTYVTNAGVLVSAEDAFETAVQNLFADKAGKIGIITAGVQAEDKAIVEEIDALAKKYGTTYKNPDATGTDAQKAYEKYIAAKTAIETADKNAAQNASDELLALVKAIPAVDKITKNDVASIQLAYDKYQALTPAAKEIFDKETTDGKTLAKDVLAKAYDAAKVLTFDLASIDDIADQTYTGEDINVDITLKDVNGNVISKDDYEVSYVDNVDAGEATVVVNPTASSKYTGTASKTFKINAASIEDAAVTGSTKTYTGKAVTTTVKVVVGDKTLTAGTDYEVTSYANNKNVGTAKVTVTGKGNYAGTADGTFIIKPAKANLTKVTAGKKKATAKYTGQTGASYKVVYAVKGTTKYKAVYSKNLTKTISSLKSGITYKVKVLAYYKDASGKAYYTGYSNMRTVKVK